MSHSPEQEPFSQPNAEGSPPTAGMGRRRIGCLLVGIGLMVAAMVALPLAPVVDGNLVKAKRTRVAAVWLVTATENYMLERGNLPIADGNSPTKGDIQFATNDKIGIGVLEALLANNREKDRQQHPYFRPSHYERGRPGLAYKADGRSVTGLLDAWGNPYQVVMDTDYDGTVVVDIAGKTETVRHRNAVVYSAGKDGELGTPDDVRSW